MGLSLRLFPIDDLWRWDGGYSHTILNVDAVSWDDGRALSKIARRLPDGHDVTAHLGARIKEGPHAGEHCYGKLASDAYGEPYRWLTASELLPFLSKHLPKHPATAYVRALPSDNLIVLDWH